jgi:uncharacterized Rmd1/YagE family protein
VEQTEVNLFSSILDSPDFLWDDDEHLPAYLYTRSYLEVHCLAPAAVAVNVS